MAKNIDEILELIDKRPTDTLAMGRTMMASDRTYLGFVRTSVGFLAGGIGIVKYIDHPFIVALGIFLIIFSIYILILGYRKHMRMKKILSMAYDTLISSVKGDNGSSPVS